jgi:hypothetical protein
MQSSGQARYVRANSPRKVAFMFWSRVTVKVCQFRV